LDLGIKCNLRFQIGDLRFESRFLILDLFDDFRLFEDFEFYSELLILENH